MFGKILVLFLVFSCVSQGYAAEVPPSNPDTRLSISDIVKLINSLIDSIQEALKNFGKLIAQFKQKIQDVIASIDIAGIVGEISQKIKDILDHAGIAADIAAGCIAAEEKAVEGLVKAATDSAAKCVQDAEGVMHQILQVAAELQSEANKLIASITGSVAKCFTDNALNPIKLLSCLQGLVDPTKEKVKGFVDEIGKAVDDSQKIANNAIDKLTTCAQNISKDVLDGKDNIINEFQKCVDKLVG